MSRDGLDGMVVGAGVMLLGPILHTALTHATNGRYCTLAAGPVRETGRVS